MGQMIIPDDLVVQGTLAPTRMNYPAGSVDNAAVKTLAGIDATKLVHIHRAVYAQPSGSVSAAEAKVVHVVHGATATLVGFKAGSVTACVGAATITVDLKKNGVSVLTATIVLDNANTARVVEAATITTAAAVAGDVFEVSVAVAAGGGTIGSGVFAYAEFYEAAL
jgi:hypothetical protein